MRLDMTSVATRVCQLKRGLLSCSGEAAGLCQYCTRLFCSRHGVVLEDGQEVCSRRFCVAKRNDLAKHLLYKEAVLLRNEASACGMEGCKRHLGGRCARCNGYFCGHHVEAREEMYLHNSVRLRRTSTLCRHCWARRPIWVRV